MANENKNINELVSEEDDPTAELEVLAVMQGRAAESGANTFDAPEDDEHSASIAELQEDLKRRSETINGLQFDIEQLRARWTGLETEIKAREEQTANLHSELDEARSKLAGKEKQLRKRDQSIKSLKAEIRDRNDAYEELRSSMAAQGEELSALQQELEEKNGADTAAAERLLERQSGQIAGAEARIRELQTQLERSERYADSMRQQLQDETEVSSEAEKTREFLEFSVDKAQSQREELQTLLDEQQSNNADLAAQLDEIHAAHAEELRVLRFELGDAQETVAQHELIAEQLASDLVDTRSYRDELEKMLNKAEEKNQSRIEELEKENQKLLKDAADHEEKLETKSEAINCLLAELSKKTQQIESIGEIEEVIHEIDDRMSERIDDRSGAGQERVTRLLIGNIEGQELRFPLFKDRLTIGRTEQNDIQLKASYVSRRHAVVVTEGDTARVIDWGSKNGVFVNSKRVTEHFLQNGDTVTIGTADFRYEERAKRDA